MSMSHTPNMAAEGNEC